MYKYHFHCWLIIDKDNNLIVFNLCLFCELSYLYGNKKSRWTKKCLLCHWRKYIKKNKNVLFKLLAKYDLISKNIIYKEFWQKNNINIHHGNGKELIIIESKIKRLKEKLKFVLIQCLFQYIRNGGYFFIDVKSNEEKNINIESINIEFLLYQKMNFFNKESQYVVTKKTLNSYRLNHNKKDKIKKNSYNLWNKTSCKSSIFLNELQSGKNSPISEVYGLMQQLNRLYYIKSKEAAPLANESKAIIIDGFTKKLSGNNVKKKIMNIIAKFFTEVKEFEKLCGVGIDQKPLFAELKNTIKIGEYLVQNKIETNNLDIKKIDDLNKINFVFEILAKSIDLHVRGGTIKKQHAKYKLSDEEIKKTTEMLGLLATFSCNYKAMLEHFQAGFYNSNNYIQWILPQQFFQDKLYDNNVCTKLSLNKTHILLCEKGEMLFEKKNILLAAKRFFIQPTKVLNRIIKSYSKEYQINNIFIDELVHDNNIKDERDCVKEFSKISDKELSDILSDYKRSIERKLNSNQRLKIRLWKKIKCFNKNQNIYNRQSSKSSDLISFFIEIMKLVVCFILKIIEIIMCK